MPVKGWIEVNDLYCKGCELCVAACPQNVLALDMEHLTPKGYHPARLVAEGCTGCNICAIICPDAAITVYREPRKKRAPKTAGTD
jgi:2-oxoglutarate ferredoxin oxidoreductase subunit delta